MSSIEQWIGVGIMSVLTVLLRASPLMINRTVLRSRPVTQLNQELPLCVMAVLVANALGSSGMSSQIGLELIALCGVALTYLMWRNALLSVIVGIGGLTLLRSLL
ncbi:MULTISPECIES: AzlD domain-containing protein [Ralstonia]|uniref:AzlD domain-containing protein n=1 Tax=Ralstonia mojiangensis TaxID=2953895 RepID=A0ABT2L9G3_9RALS|nr:AzlD domain-containing protein [Ralstonia mojiangensis]MCO5414748.1 AzlD domain-containing protein [Ralstonia mojiangensis]MCT7297716.1 AzlD domain-containing protein [Ralstonia mojiangensis]MCT7312056.1 AzlD domain-containing protein [Ralstonia mojiangensis]MCT7327491.1 AzlD domain-containing protein [Ralstonia mojiangensis]